MISNEKIIKSFTSIFDRLDFSDKSMKPSEFAEKYIKLDSAISALKQGDFSYDITPYMREIADRASPYDDARMIAILAGAQIGKTQAIIAPVILWKIANDAGNIVSLSGDADMSKKFVEERLDPIINRCFVKDLIKPSVIKKRNARTGDTATHKQFAGGSATFGGLQSINKMGKQSSYTLGFYDDWETAKIADKEQGNIFELLEQRFSTSSNKMKQYFISTPHTRPSNTENVYLLGDKRKWHVPCPCCNKMIELKWYQKNESGERVGIVFDKDNTGRLIESSVGYVCQECGKFFKEKHKYEMNLSGLWIPTAEPIRKGYYSYHIPCYFAAPGMFGWTDYAYKWLRIYENGYEDKGKLKVFKNVVMAEPWEERKTTINSSDILEHTRNYEIGIIPNLQSEKDGNDKIVLLTLGADINGTENDARLDWEVMAHSANGSVYSIDQGSIGTYYSGQKARDLKNKGERELWTYRHDEKNSVWTYFENEIMLKHYVCEDGRIMKIPLTCIDSGALSFYVYQFVEKHIGRVVAIKGTDKDKYTKPTQNLKNYKLSKEKPYLYLLEVDKYKDELSDMMSLQWDSNTTETQPAGYINYPKPNYQENKYTIDYFKQLASEEKELDVDERTGEIKGWRWKKITESMQNHFWDCEIYNLAAKEIFMNNFIKEYNKTVSLKLEPTWYNFSQLIKEMLVS